MAVNVSAIIVTRGDVDLAPCWASMPEEWEKIVWSNAMGWARVELVEVAGKWFGELHPVPNLSVYGRYAAIEHATNDLIYVQDDDVIVSDPQMIVREWQNQHDCNGPRDCVGTERGCDHCGREPWLVANMPQEFRHSGYSDSCLVGFGACFHRDAVYRAFNAFLFNPVANRAIFDRSQGDDPRYYTPDRLLPFYYRTCDVVFTTLTPRVLVDVPKEDREFASDDDRMWKQPGHVGERARMLELARMVRDA